MKKSKGVIRFYVILVVSILMVNPPILNLFNDYCTSNPITCGWPTMFLWLEFWYVVMIADFVIGALKIKKWDCSHDEKTIEPVERKR